MHNLAISGTFDDAQRIVKSLFNDASFKQKMQLGAVNSINWARILAQIVYYFYAYLQVTESEGERVTFVVPTGNFGNVLAGYYARKMGLPIDKLIVATNENDILHRLFQQGKYHRDEVKETWSPSMDIQISSNLERYLYDLSHHDESTTLKQWMTELEQSGKITLQREVLTQAQQEFSSARVTSAETIEIINKIYHTYGYLMDPHSAVGVCAAQQFSHHHKVICLACAHPAKFGKAIKEAIGEEPLLPKELQDLKSKDSRLHTVAATIADVRQYIENIPLI